MYKHGMLNVEYDQVDSFLASRKSLTSQEQ